MGRESHRGDMPAQQKTSWEGGASGNSGKISVSKEILFKFLIIGDYGVGK